MKLRIIDQKFLKEETKRKIREKQKGIERIKIDIKKLEELYKKMPVKELAKYFNVGEHIIYKRLSKYNLKKNIEVKNK